MERGQHCSSAAEPDKMDFNLTTHACFSAQNCRTTPSNSAYSRHILDLERHFNYCDCFEWGTKNWKTCYWVIVVYLAAIFTGQHYMKSRRPFNLRGALLAWNAGLAALSIFAAWRTTSAVWYQGQLMGFHSTICEGSASKEYSHSIGIYMCIFQWSKVLELGDTAFIVLRKTPLIFLHWFHHATVCFFVWSCSGYPSSIHVYFMLMNYFVHGIMYSYYVIKVLRIRVPKPINVAITSLQLIQMVGGLGVTLYASRMKRTPDVGCCLADEAVAIALSIYFLYFVLFVNFFLQTYVIGKSRSKAVGKKIN